MIDELAALRVGFACTQLITRLYQALDEQEYAALDELLAPDAEWLRLGQRTSGLEAITALMRGRPTSLATRHVITNPVVTQDGPDRARGTFYMLVVRKHGVSADMPRPLLVPAPWRLSVVRAEFRHTQSGWRISNQRTESQFEFPDEVAL